MSIFYRLDEQTDNLNPEEKRKRGLYPRVIRQRTVGLRELCERAAKGTTFNAIELEAGVQLAVKRLVEELADGNHVCIEGFGTFSVSAKSSRPATKQHDIRAESISLKRIVFKTSKILMKRSIFQFRRKS
ncbi:HU family DNA-binding protein [Sunxiuqinia rutila]|uniref:HU family DNA-binding protein n=1 Tax=Sunxiuqinia rutila TaxID=1397841 RepID=UPI003D362EF9